VHRDIKPANLLVSAEPNGEVARLVDFGLARVYQASKLSGLSMTGQVGGTVQFMAPEQITHFREAKPPVDQYAAAATLYNLLTGRYVHDFPKEFHRCIGMILQEDAVPICSRRADVPEGLAKVMQRALARQPEKRFADVTELRQGLLPFHF
jgi:serine/threonine-protein kinase